MGIFVIRDNAYVCSEILLSPLSGDDKDETMKDAFNFYLIQSRICIEKILESWQKMENPVATSASMSEETWEVIHVYYRIVEFLY